MKDQDLLIKQAEARTEKAELRAEQAETRERAMRASELSYRRLFEAARDGILILNVDTGRIDDVNPFLVELLGFSRAEIVGKTVGDLSPFKDILSNQAMLERLQNDGYLRCENLPLQTKDGRHIEVEFVSNVYQAGDVKVIQCNIRDLTDRKRAEVALRESEEKFRSMFTAAATGIAVSSPQGRFLEANAAYCQMLGYREEEMLARDFVSVTHPDDLELNLKLRQELLDGQRKSFVMEKRYLKKNGDIVWTRHSVGAARGADGAVARLIVVAENITERKRAEEALVLFRTLIDQSNDSIEVVEPGTYRYLDVNESACSSHGYTREEMLSMSVGDIDPDFNPAMRERIESVLQTLGWMMFESRHRRKDGTTFPVEVTLKLVQLDKDYTVAIVRDITERKRIEARFRRLVDSNAQGVFFWNKQGRITEANNSFLRLTGYSHEDLTAGLINWMAMTPQEYADLDQHAQKQVAATGVCVPYEKEWIRKDGKRVPILLGAAVFEDTPDEGVCFVLDLTEQKKLEEKFRQAQKMDSIGQLAGGVAHDFNNILAVIQIQCDLLRAEGILTPAQSEFMEGIGAATRRAIALTRQLLVFSRKETLQPRNLNLNESLNSITNMLRRILGEHIQIHFKFPLQPLFIHADGGKLDQVLMNLAVNSRDAMPNGGRLVIETSPVDFDESVVAQSAQARPGAFVCLSVSDTGCGIPRENLSRIFEPFFTTKDVGKGTGLGLATVFGIVQQHRGWVNVYSEVGQGTTFRIYLPRLAAASLQKPEPPGVTSLPGGNETILLVEDDDFLRPSVRQTLSKLGYRVLEAGNGLKALEVWKHQRDEIHLLLTDLVMPDGMTGKDLGERLLQMNPKLKVIYTSGYSAEIVSKDFPLNEGVNFLTKPFQTQKLAETIRNRLDRD